MGCGYFEGKRGELLAPGSEERYINHKPVPTLCPDWAGSVILFSVHGGKRRQDVMEKSDLPTPQQSGETENTGRKWLYMFLRTSKKFWIFATCQVLFLPLTQPYEVSIIILIPCRKWGNGDSGGGSIMWPRSQDQLVIVLTFEARQWGSDLSTVSICWAFHLAQGGRISKTFGSYSWMEDCDTAGVLSAKNLGSRVIRSFRDQVLNGNFSKILRWAEQGKIQDHISSRPGL